MEETTIHLCTVGKGILASDESTTTIGKRFEKVGLTNDEDTRRRYRQLFYTADVGKYYAGAIMFKETLTQSCNDGRLFVDCLNSKGILPGVKADEGLVPIPGTQGETRTKGLDQLSENLEKYKSQGAKFTKWRAALKSTDGCPSEKAICINAEQLAEYAAVSQVAGLVPIVEPELLLDGTQPIQQVIDASSRILSTCMNELWKQPVVLEHCLLKPQMINGVPSSGDKRTQVIAQETIRVLRRFIPPALPGIMFLSGGQTEVEATVNLAEINKEAQQTSHAPWRLSFSFGRALQASVLKLWSEDPDKNSEKAQRKAEELAQINALASTGLLSTHHPSILSTNVSLGEEFRGYRK
eukprot:g1026.t1